MIAKIDLKNIATYDQQGIQLNDLKKINFIYGANGCGKTTISNFVHDNSDPKFDSCSLSWQNDLPLKVLTYNKEFRLKSDGVKSSLTVQNIMRRIIENYFKLLGKYGDDDLILKFESKEEQEICRSLISWINDGSHSINDDLYVELQDRTIEAYKKVFKNRFELTNHIGHYDMMMGEISTEV